MCEESSEITADPTCFDSGVLTYTCKCDGCGFTRTDILPKLEHEISGGACKHCGYRLVEINGDNISKYTENGTITVDGFAYSKEADCFVSTNKDNNSSSEFRITAKGKMTVTIEIQASSEYLKDCLIVYCNGFPSGNVSGTNSDTITLDLFAGDVLIISYEKDFLGSDKDDCGYIRKIEIIEPSDSSDND